MRRIGIPFAVLGLFLFVQAAQPDWTPAKRLTWTAGDSWWPGIAVDSSGRLYLVWQDDTPGTPKIYFKKSSDGGAIWTPSQNITRDTFSSHSLSPEIAVDYSGYLHVTWNDDEFGADPGIFYKRSTNMGATWSKYQVLAVTEWGTCYEPRITVDSLDNLHVVAPQPPFNYYDPPSEDLEIRYLKSTDHGVTWPIDQFITQNSGNSMDPAIAVDSAGNPHLVWSDDTDGNYEILYKKSKDGGVTWTSRRRLTWTPSYSRWPVIAVDSLDNLHVVWYTATSGGDDEIYYKKSTDSGTTWPLGRRLTNTASPSRDPAIAVDASGIIHVVWSEGALGKKEIYYRKSTNGGASWTAAQRLTWTSGDSGRPDLAIDPAGNLHLVWGDSTPGNYEIYYKKYIKQ
jgi:hypothetical protein